MGETKVLEKITVEKQLYSLINSTRILTSTRNLDLVLQRIIEESIQVIEAAAIGVFFLYDKKVGGLIPKSSVGFENEFINSLILKENEGMTGKTFSSKKPTIFYHIKDTHLAMSDLSSLNNELFFKALGVYKYPISTICTPLLSGDTCIGVLTIDSYSENVTFTDQDLIILETFANQAVIAIENAKVFSQNERAKEIRSELSKVSLSKKGLTSLTSTLSTLIHQKVCIFNEFYDLVTSCSEGSKLLALNLRNTHVTLLKKAFKCRNYTRVIISLNETEVETFFFPIKSDNAIIGVLTIFAENEFDLIDIYAVEQTMMIFGIEMISQEKSFNNGYKYEGFLLDQIMKNKEVDLNNLSKIYFSENDYYMFVKLELMISDVLFEERTTKVQKFGRLLISELNNFDLKALVQEEDNEFHFLFISRISISEEEIIKKIKSFFLYLYQKSQEANLLQMVIGIGRGFQHLKDVHLSVYDSDKCIEILKLGGRNNPIFSYKELGIHRLLLSINKTDLEYYVWEKLRPLIDYDKNQNSELLPTLEAYIDTNQNMKETAKQCYVHLNTVKYRLQTVKKLLNIETISGETFFELRLALYIYYLYMK